MKIFNIRDYVSPNYPPRRESASDIVAVELEKLYPGQVVSPQLDYDGLVPEDLLEFLKEQLKTEKYDAIVGTQLGGFYAYCLGVCEKIPVILVAPRLIIMFLGGSFPHTLAHYHKLYKF